MRRPFPYPHGERPDLPQLTCPSCKQQNDTDMAFCIFCGSTLKPGSISGRKPDIAGDSCQACGKSDPLNAKFCVFCGAQITHPMPEVVEAPTRDRAGDGNPSVSIVTKAVPAKSRVAAAPIILLVLGSALGAAVGVGGAWATKTAPPAKPTRPMTGITILTSKPHSDVCLEGDDKERFVLGFTGADGNFYFSRPDQNGYVALVDHDNVKKPFAVKDSTAIVDLTDVPKQP
jgi:hypothetical protein